MGIADKYRGHRVLHMPSSWSRAAAASVLVFLAATLPFCPSARAQQRADAETHRPWVISFAEWAKWGTLASAVGLTAVAILRNGDANDIFRGLNRFCAAAPNACFLGEDGRYVDAGAETLYEETLRLDRQARAWTVAGQLFLAASGVLFLIDLVSDDDGPRNIPFAPLEMFTTGHHTGLRIRF